MHVEAIWLRTIGGKVQVLFESLGKWRLAIGSRRIDMRFRIQRKEPHLGRYPYKGRDPDGSRWALHRFFWKWELWIFH